MTVDYCRGLAEGKTSAQYTFGELMLNNSETMIRLESKRILPIFNSFSKKTLAFIPRIVYIHIAAWDKEILFSVDGSPNLSIRIHHVVRR